MGAAGRSTQTARATAQAHLWFLYHPSTTMILYVDSNFTSPYALSAFVALRVKGLNFDMQSLDLGAEQNKTPTYSATSLTSRVPTLVHDDFSLSESSAIAEYLEELQPEPRLYPANVESRARARQIQAWLRSDLTGLKQDRSSRVIFYRPTPTPLTPAGQAAAAKLIRAAESLLDPQSENLFEQWCIADTDLAFMLNRLVLNGDSVPPRLKEYAARQWALPAVKEWVNLARPPL
jgi:glutathione S-transferase